MDKLEVFKWLNPLDGLYDALADRTGFPVDQVSRPPEANLIPVVNLLCKLFIHPKFNFDPHTSLLVHVKL